MILRALWGAIGLFLVPLGAWALGLGSIELKSAFNQPLEADILLVSTTPEEVDELRATLVAAAWTETGYFSGLQFEVTQDNMGQDVIRVTSQDPITEPLVAMLVEANWSQGRLLREYTLLFDPPVLSLIPRSADTAMPGSAVVESSETYYGPVQLGETLWSVAGRFRPSGITMNQMVVAIYQVNSQAFDGNMNVLLQDVLLRIPEVTEVLRRTASEATQEAVRQTEEWKGDPSAQQAQLRLVPVADQIGVGVVVSGVAGAVRAIAELEREDIALRSELDETRRLLELRDEQLRELQTRLSELEVSALNEEIPATVVSLDPESEEVSTDDLESELIVDGGAITIGTEFNQSPLVSRVLSWATNPSLTNPYLIFGGLLVLVVTVIGTAVWYSNHRFMVKLNAVMRTMDSEREESIQAMRSSQHKRELSITGEIAEGRAILEAIGDGSDLASSEVTTEIGVKLDLARAFSDMGDLDTARSILEEVIAEGNPSQQQEAKLLIGAL